MSCMLVQQYKYTTMYKLESKGCDVRFSNTTLVIQYYYENIAYMCTWEWYNSIII